MQWCLHGAKGYRRRGPTAWLCCWSAEPVFFWPAGSSGPKRFSPPLQGLTPGLGITTKEKSNIRPDHTLLTSAWQKRLKISKCWFSFFFLNKPFAKCVKQHSLRKGELVVMVTSLSSSGGSWSRLWSLLRLCLWLWWKRKKSEALFFRRYRTRPRVGTQEYVIAGRADDTSKKYSSIG